MRKFGSKCCFCCRVRPKREDWMQKDAKEKLNLEIDILDIVKRLRVYQFASEIVLKPRQRELVSFFDQYKLMDEDERLLMKSIEMRESNMDSKGNQHKGEVSNIEDLLVKNKRISKVVKAVKLVSESDPVDAIIIERVTNQKDRSRSRLRS